MVPFAPLLLFHSEFPESRNQYTSRDVNLIQLTLPLLLLLPQVALQQQSGASRILPPAINHYFLLFFEVIRVKLTVVRKMPKPPVFVPISSLRHFCCRVVRTLPTRIRTTIVLINFEKIGPLFTPYYVCCDYFFLQFWSYGLFIPLDCAYSFLI